MASNENSLYYAMQHNAMQYNVTKCNVIQQYNAINGVWFIGITFSLRNLYCCTYKLKIPGCQLTTLLQNVTNRKNWHIK